MYPPLPTLHKVPYLAPCPFHSLAGTLKYFEFYCKFYYFYEHLQLKMFLSTKYLDNLRPFTKQVKNDKEKQ